MLDAVDVSMHEVLCVACMHVNRAIERWCSRAEGFSNQPHYTKFQTQTRRWRRDVGFLQLPCLHHTTFVPLGCGAAKFLNLLVRLEVQPANLRIPSAPAGIKGLPAGRPNTSCPSRCVATGAKVLHTDGARARVPARA